MLFKLVLFQSVLLVERFVFTNKWLRINPCDNTDNIGHWLNHTVNTYSVDLISNFACMTSAIESDSWTRYEIILCRTVSRLRTRDFVCA